MIMKALDFLLLKMGKMIDKIRESSYSNNCMNKKKAMSERVGDRSSFQRRNAIG